MTSWPGWPFSSACVPALKTLLPYRLLALIGVVYTLISATVALLRGNRDARVLGLGFLLAAGFSAYDMLAAIGLLPRVRTSFAHFGHGAFALSLGLILLFRFQRVYADLLSTKADLSEKYGALQACTAEVEQLNSSYATRSKRARSRWSIRCWAAVAHRRKRCLSWPSIACSISATASSRS